ncbi:type II/IV secretion system ATPase subunit [Candidatus Woesearchaeota archaeon]|nr:type II/IV secretion system ATPase subunit [Candidatus Woesearchaeota archaeon]
MVISENKTKDYELSNEGSERVLRIDYTKKSIIPSIEDSEECMMDVLSRLAEIPGVGRVVLVQQRNYNYSYNQIQLLAEIARLYNHLIKQQKFIALPVEESHKYLASKIGIVRGLVRNLIKDPLGTYVELKRVLREEKIILGKLIDEPDINSCELLINILKEFFDLLERTKLINVVKNRLDGHQIGNREIYSQIFRAEITPNFVFTRLMSKIPVDGEEIDSYKVGNADVNIFSVPEDIKYLYHINPVEFKLSEDKQELLEMARNVLIEHKPRAEEFLEPERMRSTFFNIGRDLLQELADRQNVKMNYKELDELTNVLVRYTVGFGMLEVLLQDEKIQDITINGPIGITPIFIVHQDYDECFTNIIPSAEDADNWATKFRILSGRPLDEANPILDTELTIPGARARVAIVGRPLNPKGLAYAFRRHRDKPWTLPLFVDNRMISPLGAGLMSFLIDGARTIIVAGTRSSGKTSFLGSLLVEVMRKYRLITVEDTLELATDQMRELGYNIQPMKVRSALAGGATEVAAEEGIRTALRMGDSALIVGEIRSQEARALYEAMRIGALANVVAGTIHGDSPYGVYDRVVNDLNVPRTSFKATDIIVIVNPVRSADGLSKFRRVVQITEVRKKWEDDPLAENGFVDLMKYDSKTDSLQPTDDLINGNSDVIKNIASNIPEWAGHWDAVWDNIILRAKMKEMLVNYAQQYKKKEMLEARFVIAANDHYHRVAGGVKNEIGSLDARRIFFEWEEWLKKAVKKI